MEITKETKNLTFLKLGKDRKFYKERETDGEIEAVQRRFQKKLSVTPIILHRYNFLLMLHFHSTIMQFCNFELF